MNANTATPDPELPGTDELLECLLVVARAHGELPTREAIMAGLPAEQARLSPALFERAAKRAHLSSRLVKSPLRQLKSGLLPAIALLQGKRACVVLELSEDRAQARVVYPDLPDSPVSVALDVLQAEYIGTAIYARPTHRFDARTPAVRKGRQGHWFWSVMAESRPLYVDVLFAAFLFLTLVP